MSRVVVLGLNPGRVLRAFCALFLSLIALGAVEARAEGVPACPTGNLLAGRRPAAWVETRRELGVLTDEAVVPEGAAWDSGPAMILDKPASSVTFDLGEPTIVTALVVQADANDSYVVWGSRDGNTYQELGHVPVVPDHGLRTRTLELSGITARYLRVGGGSGDGFFSLSEVAAYCQKPSPFPPRLRVVDAPAAKVIKPWWGWDDVASARWELILAILALLFLWWDRWVSRGAPIEPAEKAPGPLDAVARFFQGLTVRLGVNRVSGRVRRLILGIFGVVAFLTYFNFGAFHFFNYIHGWDTFHYYVGAKYSPELSFDRLYECVAVADSELPELRHRVETRKLTNLRTNVVETTADILAHPERCKQHFTPERWQSFHKDLAYFRTLESAKRWDDSQTDHGYNATPVWNIAGYLLSNLAQASKTQVYVLNSLDPIMLGVACLMIAWAFGWRILAVALLVFSTNFPSRFYWTGGAFLRWDWLFWMIASACLLKKNRPLAAGLALAYSSLLRIFPLFLFLAPVLAAGYHLWKQRKLHPVYMRFFVGAALGAALLVPAGMAVVGRASAYTDFAQNTLKHTDTALTNNMGLRTVLAYRPSEVGRLMRATGQTDEWAKWKQARLASWHQAKPVYFAVVIAFVVLLGLAARNAEPWAAMALSATFIPFGTELTCYYYSFLIIVALLAGRSEKLGTRLLLLTGFTQFVAAAPIKGMPTWLDEQYTLMSAATVLVLVLTVWEFYRSRRLALAEVPDFKVAVDGPEEMEEHEEAEASRGRRQQRKRRR